MQQTVISAKHRWAIWKHSLIQYFHFREPFKVRICTLLSFSPRFGWTNIKVWKCSALPENRYIHSSPLFIFCSAPSLTAVSLQLLTQPQQPLFCQQKCSQEWSAETCPFFSFTGRKKNIWFNYRGCQASMSLWWPEVSFGEIKSTNVVELFQLLLRHSRIRALFKTQTGKQRN